MALGPWIYRLLMETIRKANPDEAKTNQNARIYPKTTLQYNNKVVFDKQQYVKFNKILKPQ